MNVLQLLVYDYQSLFISGKNNFKCINVCRCIFSICFYLRTLQLYVSFQVVSPLNDIYYEVLNMETSGELDRNLLNLNLNLSNLINSPSITSIDTLTPKEEYQSGS